MLGSCDVSARQQKVGAPGRPSATLLDSKVNNCFREMDRTSRFMFQWSMLPMATLFLNLFLLRFAAVLQARGVCG